MIATFLLLIASFKNDQALTGEVIGRQGYLYLKLQDEVLLVDFSKQESLLSDKLTQLFGLEKSSERKSKNSVSSMEVDGVIGTDVLFRYDLIIDTFGEKFAFKEPADDLVHPCFKIVNRNGGVSVQIGSIAFGLDFLRKGGIVKIDGSRNLTVWSNHDSMIPELPRFAFASTSTESNAERFGTSLLVHQYYRLSLFSKKLYYWNERTNFPVIVALRSVVPLPFDQVGDTINLKTIPDQLIGTPISTESPIVKVNDMHISEFTRSIQLNSNRLFEDCIERRFKVKVLGFRVNNRLFELELE